jgi:hypothetical protein
MRSLFNSQGCGLDDDAARFVGDLRHKEAASGPAEEARQDALPDRGRAIGETQKTAIYSPPARVGCLMTSTMNYAIAAVLVMGLLAVGLAILVW